MGVAEWHFHEPHPNYRTLPEVLASGKYNGFDVVQGPDRPGPYKDMEATCAGPGEPLSGSLWANGKSRRFHVPGVPGEEFRVVGLIPQDGGEPTYVVLKQRAAQLRPWGKPRNEILAADCLLVCRSLADAVDPGRSTDRQTDLRPWQA